MKKHWYEYCGDCKAEMDCECPVELKSLITGYVDNEDMDLMIEQIIKNNAEDNYVARICSCQECGFKAGILTNLSDNFDHWIIISGK
ncbi:MAG: hypothetical protein HQ552_01950 [Desulfobacteraceae bacterium]|nr:hypothetical protein [Desulfobacteraceae bacterium]